MCCQPLLCSDHNGVVSSSPLPHRIDALAKLMNKIGTPPRRSESKHCSSPVHHNLLSHLSLMTVFELALIFTLPMHFFFADLVIFPINCRMHWSLVSMHNLGNFPSRYDARISVEQHASVLQRLTRFIRRDSKPKPEPELILPAPDCDRLPASLRPTLLYIDSLMEPPVDFQSMLDHFITEHWNSSVVEPALRQLRDAFKLIDKNNEAWENWSSWIRLAISYNMKDVRLRSRPVLRQNDGCNCGLHMLGHIKNLINDPQQYVSETQQPVRPAVPTREYLRTAIIQSAKKYRPSASDDKSPDEHDDSDSDVQLIE